MTSSLRPAQPRPPTTFLWLDLTRACQLACQHCYNDSGPTKETGIMGRVHWFSVLDQSVQLGVRKVQLIGGEPTLHPSWAELVEHALRIGLKVEVFSNLVHVKPEWWKLFQRQGVSIATSYYAKDAAEHNRITARDSHRKTRANIARAIQLDIPLRVGIISVRPTQSVAEAQADLSALGVMQIGTDRMRHFGRGQHGYPSNDGTELCGMCGYGRAAVGPDGMVTPCVMSSWLTAGSVRDAPLAEILSGEAMAQATAKIREIAAGPCEPGCECRPDAYPCYPENE